MLLLWCMTRSRNERAIIVDQSPMDDRLGIDAAYAISNLDRGAHQQRKRNRAQKQHNDLAE